MKRKTKEHWGRCLECARWHPLTRQVQSLGRCEIHNMDCRGFEQCPCFREFVIQQGTLETLETGARKASDAEAAA